MLLNKKVLYELVLNKEINYLYLNTIIILLQNNNKNASYKLTEVHQQISTESLTTICYDLELCLGFTRSNQFPRFNGVLNIYNYYLCNEILSYFVTAIHNVYMYNGSADLYRCE